jgi:hypothetical protein
MDSIEQIVTNSYKNFHAKGVSYLCLKRTPNLTVKLYHFDGDVSKLPEVVNPHDHRYAFTTYVLAGAIENTFYEKHELGMPFSRFAFRTPLLGGTGFGEVDAVNLRKSRCSFFHADSRMRARYTMGIDQIHTINVRENETVLMLYQFEDEIPADQPTYTYCLSDVPPSLDGLYDRPTPDEVRALIARLELRTGMSVEELSK